MPIESKEVLEKRGGSIWDISSIYKIEHNKISEKIKREALEIVGNSPQTTKDQAIKSVKNLIKSEYHPSSRMVAANAQIFQAAQKDEFKKLSPNKSQVRMWFFIMLISMLIEVSVILYLSYAEGEIALPQLILAVLLAAGGYFSGVGVGQLLFNHYVNDLHKKNATWISLKEKTNNTTVMLVLVIGMLLLLGCSYFRFYMADGDVIAGGITLLLGLFIMVAESNYLLRKNQYDKYTDLMFKALTHYAVFEHNKNNPDQDNANYDISKDNCAIECAKSLSGRLN